MSFAASSEKSDAFLGMWEISCTGFLWWTIIVKVPAHRQGVIMVTSHFTSCVLLPSLPTWGLHFEGALGRWVCTSWHTLGRGAAEGWGACLGPLSMAVGQRKLLQCLCTGPSTPNSKRGWQRPLIDRWVFSVGSAVVLWLHKDEPLFFLSPVVSVPPLALNASFLPST